ncbi:hypothetical protein B0H13DRAFT_1867084 [Mycena leptocephala]|nr:hypothetical protein B0H13DRAFT_1867084 [Mycena leptocephala]
MENSDENPDAYFKHMAIPSPEIAYDGIWEGSPRVNCANCGFSLEGAPRQPGTASDPPGAELAQAPQEEHNQNGHVSFEGCSETLMGLAVLRAVRWIWWLLGLLLSGNEFKVKAIKPSSGVEHSEPESEPKPARKKPGPNPKPKVKPVPRPKKSKKNTETDDEDIELVKPVPAPTKIVLMIPEAATEGCQRVSLKSSTSFDDAIEVMHETVGCVSVEGKPTLAYEFSTANKNATTINLRTEENCDGLVSDVLAKMKTKKDISINISLLPENASVTKTGKGKGKLTVMGLDNTESEPEGDGDEDVEAGEKKALSVLDAEYRKCVRCGPTAMCKIDRGGNHVHLTFPQRRAWAVSLACGTNKVTKTTPPDSSLFSMFHTNAKAPTPPPVPVQPHPQYPYFPPMPPVGYGLPGFQIPGYLRCPCPLLLPLLRIILSCQAIHLMMRVPTR